MTSDKLSQIANLVRLVLSQVRLRLYSCFISLVLVIVFLLFAWRALNEAEVHRLPLALDQSEIVFLGTIKKAESMPTGALRLMISMDSLVCGAE